MRAQHTCAHRFGNRGKSLSAEQFGKTSLYGGHETRAGKNEGGIELNEARSRPNLLVGIHGTGHSADADQWQPASSKPVDVGQKRRRSCKQGPAAEPTQFLRI